MDKYIIKLGLIFVPLILILLVCFMVFQFQSVMQNFDDQYILDNGVVCDIKTVTDGAIIFSDCTDGKSHVNPSEYRCVDVDGDNFESSGCVKGEDE